MTPRYVYSYNERFVFLLIFHIMRVGLFIPCYVCLLYTSDAADERYAV